MNAFFISSSTDSLRQRHLWWVRTSKIYAYNAALDATIDALTFRLMADDQSCFLGQGVSACTGFCAQVWDMVFGTAGRIAVSAHLPVSECHQLIVIIVPYTFSSIQLHIISRETTCSSKSAGCTVCWLARNCFPASESMYSFSCMPNHGGVRNFKHQVPSHSGSYLHLSRPCPQTSGAQDLPVQRNHSRAGGRWHLIVTEELARDIVCMSTEKGLRRCAPG